MGRQTKRQEVETYSTVKKHVSPICDRLKLLVNKDNIAALSEKLGVSTRSVHFWCQGQSRPDVDSLAGIADFFNTTVDYICGRVDVQTRSMDNLAASEVYGLSVETLDNLLLVKDGYFDECGNEINPPDMLVLLDLLLSNKGFYLAVQSALEWYAEKTERDEDYQEFCEWKAARSMERFLLEFFRTDFQSIYKQRKERK
jgi:transcriptional regulator with XRE-family HTH domain